jgi:5-methyltetrahydrofolate--homocysteine methyltransferase
MELLEKISEELQNGNFIDVPKLTREALVQGISPAVILSDALVAGMDVVGEKFRRDELFMPEVLIAAKAMQAAMAVLRPRLIETGVETAGTIVIGTIQGDLHDIGKNLVGMFFEGAGYQVIDLGVDVAPGRFVEAVRTHKPDIVGLSALLTTTMSRMREVIESLVEAGLRGSVKVMVGGAPVTEKFARDIGADGYSPDAASAVEKARTLKP